MGSSPYGAAADRVVELGHTTVSKARLEAFLADEATRALRSPLLQPAAPQLQPLQPRAGSVFRVSGVPHDILELPRVLESNPNKDLIMPLIPYIEATLKTGGVPQLQDPSGSALATLLAPPRPQAAVTDQVAAPVTSSTTTVTPAGTDDGRPRPADIDGTAKLKDDAPAELETTNPITALDIAARAGSHRKISNKDEFANLAHSVLTNISDQE